MRFFDSHSHYNDKRFGTEWPGGVDKLLEQLFDSTLGWAVDVGTNPQTNTEVLEQAKQWPNLYAAIGYHPEDIHYMEGNPEMWIEKLHSYLLTKEIRKSHKIVALGEIGLDYHYEFYDNIPMDKEKEMQYFQYQLELAQQCDLPVIIHDREAHGDCFDTILKFPRVMGVFHSYSGSPEMARELVRHGWYISFSGTVSFKNARKVRECVLEVPRDRIMIETDCPYLTPHPHRGELNHSGYLEYTASAIGEVLDMTVEQVAELTAKNALNFYRLS